MKPHSSPDKTLGRVKNAFSSSLASQYLTICDTFLLLCMFSSSRKQLERSHELCCDSQQSPRLQTLQTLFYCLQDCVSGFPRHSGEVIGAAETNRNQPRTRRGIKMDQSDKFTTGRVSEAIQSKQAGNWKSNDKNTLSQFVDCGRSFCPLTFCIQSLQRLGGSHGDIHMTTQYMCHCTGCPKKVSNV